MIAIQVATCKSVMANELKDVRALFTIYSVLLFMALGFALTSLWYLTALLIIVLIAMIIPLADYYWKWSKRIDVLLDATKNVPVHIDF
jgi:phosphoglycerol transferase MdoB-like AlkP superfamily enzyme